MSTSNLTPELVRETLRQADAPLALGAAIARAGRAVGAAISDAEGVKAVSMPAAEAMDWRATCLIEEARDGVLNVHSPDRRHFLCRDGWHDYPNGYDVSELGCYVSRVGAAKALAACQSPYPGFIPSAIEAAHNADIGDGLGLDHDQSRRTLAATMAKMPELGGGAKVHISKDGEAPTADDLIATLSALPVDGEYVCFWGQSVAAALSFVNDDNSIEVAFVGEGTKPRVCFRRLRNKAMRENLTPRPYHVMLSVMVEVDAEDKSDAWNNARDAVRRVGGKHIEVIDALNVAEA